jgi:hypothetical protein
MNKSLFKLLSNTLLIMSIIISQSIYAKPIKNGFDLSSATISVDKILTGGPPRDGIPSIDNPKFLNADKANF